MSVRRGRRLLSLAGLLFLAAPGFAAAQTRDTPGAESFTGPSLPWTHWAVEAARRVDGMGLVTDYLPAQRVVPLEAVAAALREAMERAPIEAPYAADLAAQWNARLQREFPRILGPLAADSGGFALDARVDVGVGAREGAVAPGTGEIEPHRTGALPLPDLSTALGDAWIGARQGRHLGVSLVTGADAEGARLGRLEVAAAAGAWRASAGRIPVGYAYGFGGGTMFTGAVPVDAVQVYTRRSARAPGFLSAIGPVSFHGFFGQLRDDRHQDEPMIWGASAQVRPHHRVTLAVNRGSLFGGDQAVTFRRVVDMLVGRVTGIGFENQIVSVSVKFLAPSEAVVPLELYVEWGAEDAAGAWRDVPGVITGIWTPGLPFAPWLSAGFEYTTMASSCCGNPSWYRHWSFNGSWASRDEPLGHPLGGAGREAMAHMTIEVPQADLAMNGRVFQRRREAENLYSPGRAGTSRGGAIGATWFATPRLRAELDGSIEDGEGWRETRFRIQGGMIF